MKRKVVPLVALLIVAVILIGATVAAQGTGYSQAKATALNFLNQLQPCVLDHGDLQIVQNPCFAQAGCYCMYYQDDPAWVSQTSGSIHGFGWYPCKTKCSALYQLVEEPTRNCCFNNVIYPAPHQVMPPYDAGIVFQIPPTHAPAGFYLNNPYGRQSIQGLYYTDSTRNESSLQHAWIFSVTFRPGKCKCLCNNTETKPTGNTMFVIVWEDGCGGFDMDVNDFVAALIPVTCPCQ